MGIKNSKFPGTEIVSSLKLKLVRICVAFTILGLAFKTTSNPIKAFRLLRSLMLERINIHENAGEIKAVRSGKHYYWSINIPGWPSDNFNRFILNEFHRISSPLTGNLQTIIFAITNLCPLNCIHCYESENLSDNNRLSLDDLKLVMSKIENNGIRHIQFSGGEPLSRFDDMIELMRFSGKKNDYWINTSGFGLTQGKAALMKQNGMTGAIISLDHWDENSHNNFRKNNKSFNWVMQAVKNCNAAGIVVCLSICPVKEFVSEENLSRFHLLAKESGAGFVRIMEPRRTGRFSDKDVILDSSMIRIIDEFVVLRNRDLYFKDFPVLQFPGHHQRKSGCLGAGNRYIYIDANGEIHSCPFCRKPLGNILTHSIEEGVKKARVSGCQVFKTQMVI